MKKYLLIIPLIAFAWWLPASPAQASVIFAGEEHSALGTGTLSTTTLTSAAPEFAIVYVTGKLATADGVNACTYGGVSMTEVSGSPVVKTATEALEVHAFFLGASIPTGVQTVQCTVNTSNSKQLHLYYGDGATTEIVDSDTVSSDSVSDPTVTMQVSSRISFVSFASASGLNDVVTNSAPFTGYELGRETDDVSQGYVTYRKSTESSSDATNCGYDQNVSAEDAVLICTAISEVVAAGGDDKPDDSVILFE